MGRYRVLVLFSLLGIIINFNLFIQPVWGFMISLVIYGITNFILWKLITWIITRSSRFNFDTANWVAGSIIFVSSIYGYGLQLFPLWISDNELLAHDLEISSLYKKLYLAVFLVAPLLIFLISRKERGKDFLSAFLVAAVFITAANRCWSYYKTYVGFAPKEVLNIPDNIPESRPLQDTAVKPDIYYFIMDGYTGNAALKTYWNFDNDTFTQQVRNLGFQVADSARTNIGATIGVVSSVFNLSAFNSPELYKYNMGLIIHKNIRENVLFNLLKRSGYEIHTNSLFFDEKPYYFSQGEMHPNAIFLSNFLTRHLFFRVAFKVINVLQGDEYKDDNWLYGYDTRVSEDIEQQINEIKSGGQPVFYYNHLMITHPIYRYTGDGQPTEDQVTVTNGKTYYLDQVKYNNTMCYGYFSSLVDTYRKLNKPLVIIAQSDHGSKELGEINEDSQIQLMIYDSQHKINHIDAQEDGINLMRIVAGTYLEYPLPRQPYEYYNIFSK